MKKLITICLLLGVIVKAQSQVSWGEEGKKMMEQAFRIVGKRVTQEAIQSEIVKMNKNSFMPDGKESCLRLNLYYDYERLGKRFDPIEGHYLITVDLVWGNAPVGIVHPISKRYLISSSYVVPQDLIPTYQFYRPTEKQRKKMTKEEREAIGEGLLVIQKASASTKNKLSKRRKEQQ